MTSRHFTFALSSSLVAIAAYGTGCSGAKGGGGNGGGTGPHALGTIVLGESHAPSGGSSTPLVSAAFVPDAGAAATNTCATTIDGCTFATAPVCGTGCAANEQCTFDAACSPTCTPACTLACAAGQECYFVTANTPACRAAETFDAGALAFAGTTSPITLFPPYAYQSSGAGAPFLPGTQIHVQASGATGAGFDKFQDTFTATTFIQTIPPIDQIATATIYGAGPIPIGWMPGTDTLTITVAGAGGTATCTADDTTGSFQIPRPAVTAAQGTSGGSALVVTVTRERDQLDKSESTHGSLATATVQPVGWVEMSTVSSESATFQGCAGTNDTTCPDGCYDLSSDQDHCGSCTTVCASTQSCVGGTCTTGSTADCSTCEASAESGTCASSFSVCAADAECSSYISCTDACAAGNTACTSTCAAQYPTGSSEGESLVQCVCDDACASPCAAACASQ